MHASIKGVGPKNSELRWLEKGRNIEGYQNMSKNNYKIYLLNHKDIKHLCPFKDLQGPLPRSKKPTHLPRIKKYNWR